jgi:anti-anti-sigma factor
MQLNFQGQEGNLVRVAGRGTMTLLSPPDQSDAVKQALGPDFAGHCVLFDLAGVDYIDSSGISWLLVLHSRLAENGGRLIVHSAPQRVGATFELLSLATVLHIARDEAGARALARGEAP